MALDAGKLRHRLLLQRPETVRDPWGQEVESWVDVAEVWAGDESLSMRGMANAKEAILGGAETSVGMRWITIRARNDIRATWRVMLKHGRLAGMPMEVKDIRDGRSPGEMNLIVQVLNG